MSEGDLMTVKARRFSAVLAVTITSTLWCLPNTAHATQATSLRPGSSEALSPMVLGAMQRDLHIDAATARRRVAAEAAAARAEATLVPALGTAYAGSWFDASRGTLVVNITDPARARQVRDGGATPKVLPDGFSLAKLHAIKAKLDALAAATPPTAATTPAAAGVASWHVDPVSNRVIVTTIAGHRRGSLARTAAAAGEAVRFQTTSRPATSSADDWTFIDGGEGILSGSQRCSVGFNARLTYPDLPGVSDPVVISAGHCSTGGSTDVMGFGNSPNISVSLGRWWLRDLTYDWGIIGSIHPRWWQGAWISQHTPDDVPLHVRGTQQRPIGSSICKSGVTTKITCGVIRARGESAYQSDMRRTVFNLTRDTACAEKSDSGGPHYTPDIQAQGIGSTITVTDTGHCLQTIGQENRSWYVEIGYIQSYTGARVTTL
jgi:streptogrisin C